MADRFRTGANWEDLRVFAALARHGSLSAAARALGVNHATVARRLGRLEDTLGQSLFDRRREGFTPTAAGRGALQAAAAMETAAYALGARPASPVPAGLVRITAPPSLAEGFLIPHVAELRALHPAVHLELTAELRALSLPRHEADLALRLGRPARGELLARRVASIGYGFYAAPAWRDRLAAGAPPEFVGFDEGRAHLPEAVWLRRQFPDRPLVLRTNGLAGQAAAARAGIGVALVPHFLAAVTTGLIPVVLGEAPPARELWLLSRPDAAKDSAAAAVKVWLAALFTREAARLGGGQA